MEHLGEFSTEDVFPFISTEKIKRDYQVGDKIYSVKMDSQRYHVFKANQACVVCGLIGTKMILDIHPRDRSPHFNLYGEEAGQLVLMTKDHILAKSKGGNNLISNLQTMCSVCNGLKGNCGLTNAQVKELRCLCPAGQLPTKDHIRQKMLEYHSLQSVLV